MNKHPIDSFSKDAGNHPDVDPQDRAAIVDALYRFGAGQDLRDRALFESAFSVQAKLDITGPARRLGVELPVMQGREAITDALMASVVRLDTIHTVTNPRITAYNGRYARLFVLVEALNLPRGDHSRHLLLKNIYTVDLSNQDGDWTIDHLLIENMWLSGDPEVLFPKPAE
jgi:hypothetical protein